MCGDGGIIATQEQHGHQPHKIMIDLALLLESDRLRLFIGSLDQAHTHPLGDQLLAILLAAVQAGLDNRAYMLELFMHAQGDVYCPLCVRRTLHIDTHKNGELLRILQDATDILFA